MHRSENIKVAVRVRPFNNREIDSQLIIDMQGNKTILKQSRDSSKNKTYEFDYALWSFDKYTEDEEGTYIPTDQKYMDQQRIYRKLGIPLLQNVFEGYNCSMLAYGQTGSGKSYSILGYKGNEGMLEKMCVDIFKMVEKQKQMKVTISMSMVQLYNEIVQDLFVEKKYQPKQGLKINQAPDRASFIVVGKRQTQVHSYQQIKECIKFGSRNRKIQATSMNQLSSRAHTIVQICISFFKIQVGQKNSTIQIIDLAGSQRQNSTKSTGMRLKQACNINKSLSFLGQVIKSITENASHIPYNNSKLTRILKNTLGGNSKTIMICSISPSSQNYEETRSTLEFAKRVKTIRNVVRKNDFTKQARLKRIIDEKISLSIELQSQSLTGKRKAQIQKRLQQLNKQLQQYQVQEIDSIKNKLNKVMKEKDTLIEGIKNILTEQDDRKKLKLLENLYRINVDPLFGNRPQEIKQQPKQEIKQQPKEQQQVEQVKQIEKQVNIQQIQFQFNKIQSRHPQKYQFIDNPAVLIRISQDPDSQSTIQLKKQRFSFGYKENQKVDAKFQSNDIRDKHAQIIYIHQRYYFLAIQNAVCYINGVQILTRNLKYLENGFRISFGQNQRFVFVTNKEKLLEVPSWDATEIQIKRHKQQREKLDKQFQYVTLQLSRSIEEQKQIFTNKLICFKQKFDQISQQQKKIFSSFIKLIEKELMQLGDKEQQLETIMAEQNRHIRKEWCEQLKEEWKALKNNQENIMESIKRYQEEVFSYSWICQIV